jgi:hypothetical protein
MVDRANDDLAGGNTLSLDLGMATQAEVQIRLGEHLGIDRAMRLVAGSTTFPQSLMGENHRSGLFAVALRARLVLSCQTQAAGGLEDIQPMRIMALNTIHFTLENRVPLGKVELGARFEVALQAGGGITTGIDDEFAAAASSGDVFAARAVTALAPGQANQLRVFDVNSRMRTGGEHPNIICVAVEADSVPDKSSVGDAGCHYDRALDRGTGDKRRRSE